MNGLFFLLTLVACITITHVHAGTYRILGGRVKEYNKAGDEYWGSGHQWGQSSMDGNSKEIEIESCYCDTVTRDGKDGFCKHVLVVSTTGSTTQEHYQLVGSEQRIYDKHDVHIDTSYSHGIVKTSDIIKKIHVANCETWCQKKKDFRNGDLYFYVNRTTQPSSTDDFSTVSLKQGHPDEHHDENFLGTRDDTSKRVWYNGVRRWDSAFGTHGYLHAYVWVAPAALVEAKPLDDQAQSDGIRYNTRKKVTLRNEGSGVTSPDMPILGTQVEETFINQARFMTSYDFGYQFKESLSVTVKAIEYEGSGGLEMSQTFDYHSEEEMTTTRKVNYTVKVTWPDQCPPGFEITYKMEEHSEEQRLPVQLTFERAGERWAEIDIMNVKLEKFVFTKQQCCIKASADPTCGADTPMCDGSSAPSADRKGELYKLFLSEIKRVPYYTNHA